MALNRLRKTEPQCHELFVDKDFESTEEIVQAALIRNNIAVHQNERQEAGSELVRTSTR